MVNFSGKNYKKDFWLLYFPHEDSIAIDLPDGMSIRFNGKAQQKAVKIISAIISAYVLP